MLHSPYHSIPQTSLNGFYAGHVDHPGLTLAHTPNYTFQQLHQHQQHVDVLSSQFTRARPLPYGRAASTGGLIRRRISRACDQCNQLRTKCNGEAPCLHCQQFGLQCEYVRERKKRGKASRKDLAARAAAAAAAAASVSASASASAASMGSGDKWSLASAGDTDPKAESASEVSSSNKTSASTREVQVKAEERTGRSQSTASLDSIPEFDVLEHGHLDSPSSVDLSSYGRLYPAYEHMGAHMMDGTPDGCYGPAQGAMSSYPELPELPELSELPYSLGAMTGQSGSYLGDSPLNNTRPLSDEIGTAWMNMSPPPSAQFTLSRPAHAPSGYDDSQIRYPVLEPLMAHLENVVSASLACDLMDHYFSSSSSSSSSSSAQIHAVSPYVLAFVFRKKSFMHPTKPRPCKKALLASMLLVAAQTSDAPALTSVPSARDKTCRRLLELTLGLLKPLVHTWSSSSSSSSPLSWSSSSSSSSSSGRVSPASTMSSTMAGGLSCPAGPVGMDVLLGESGSAAGSLDDVVTYIHLATLTSASEYKSASIRWWSAAWSLARELKLGREVAPRASRGNGRDDFMGDEEREERRRVWWLAYMVDRHLALCYNRPLFLLDAECSGLFQPMDDGDFQNGLFTDARGRARGPAFECTGHGIFGFLLPLMTILGEIVDLHHARNHPRKPSEPSREWVSRQSDMSHKLDGYEASFERYVKAQAVDEQANEPTSHGPLRLQLQLVAAYARHMTCVLRILQFDKWDYMDLLDDTDLWIGSPGFAAATQHAVDAAEAVGHILEYDATVAHMPFFSGMYLLQGSLPLLLVAEKLRLEAPAGVLAACETVVRAHEASASVGTLASAYQRDFARVMTSALQDVVHVPVPERYGERQRRRRALLAQCRWTGDGTGLVV